MLILLILSTYFSMFILNIGCMLFVINLVLLYFYFSLLCHSILSYFIQLKKKYYLLLLSNLKKPKLNIIKSILL